jgi:hypothetical protein
MLSGRGVFVFLNYYFLSWPTNSAFFILLDFAVSIRIIEALLKSVLIPKLEEGMLVVLSTQIMSFFLCCIY